MNSFSFDHLTSVEFEELCYDLLQLEGGFKNLSWRKGTGFNSSPADQGRDIEAQSEIQIGGKCITQKWFFECKHHKAGIPPDKIQSALAWAEAKSPHYLIFIASNFFSNPTKEYIDSYENTRRPFNIVILEKNNLEGMLIKQPHIREKYGINNGTIDIELPSNMHKWKNDSLAKVFKFLMDNSKHSNICFRSIRKDSEQVYVINLPIEYADSLNKVTRIK